MSLTKLDPCSVILEKFAKKLEKTDALLILSFDGVDETSAHTQRARQVYLCVPIRSHHKYVDLFASDENNAPHIHYSRFHEFEELPPLTHIDENYQQ